MAKDKPSFVLYCDLFFTLAHLTDEQAGSLFKLILAYVNDKKPADPENLILKVAFEPIRQYLKRDLKKWEKTKVKRSDAGRKGGIKSGESRKHEANEANASGAKQNEANEAVIVNGIVTVNVNGNVEYWDSIKENFLNDFKWQEKFCKDKGIGPHALVDKMHEFISDTELKEDYKGLKELRKHFTNTFNKNEKNGKPGEKLGTSGERLAALKNF